MRAPSMRRLFSCNLIIFFNFLILWQSGSHVFHSSASLLPQVEVFSLNAFILQLKTSVISDVSVSYCENPVKKYGYEINCNCVNSNCHISEIKFSGLGLSGTIGVSIGDLSGLTIINLSNNELRGPIPDVLGNNLPKLITLDLSNNQLTGIIPASLGNLMSLKYLYLHYNFLGGVIPSDLGQLLLLEHLYLYFNMLSGSIPKTLGRLQNLTILQLGENRLTGRLPGELANLTNLVSFWIPSNYLVGELPNFENLTNLRQFIVPGNQFSGQLPSYVTKWPYLEALSLQGNEFKGPLPPDYFRMSNLGLLMISDLAGNTETNFPIPTQANLPKIYRLQLRKCSLSGPIPDYIGELTTLIYLDLSFNNLTGGIPVSMRPNLIYLSLARNNLNGTIPYWIYQASHTRMDLSYNNFSSLDIPVPSDLDLNMFACCCCEVSTATKPYMLPVDMMNKYYFPGKKSKFHNLFINSGGEQTYFNGNHYEADNKTWPFHISSAQNWANSFSGDLLTVTPNSSDYTKKVTCRISNSEASSLYDDARVSPVSLNYYGFGLREGHYNVTLHFAEIIYIDDVDYNILRKRLFDIHIQGERVAKDFNIREQAGGPNTAIILTYKAEVNKSHSVLDIHLYWTGRGTYSAWPAFNGPLISAISVKPLFKVGDEKFAAWKIALIAVASLIVASLLILALAWYMGWLDNKELKEKIKVGEYYDKGAKKDINVLLKKVVQATENFSDGKRIGKSGFLGSVYKAEVLKASHITVAVKKLHARHKGKINGFIRTEISHMTKLEGVNIVKLLHVHIGKELQLLVYEYMEKESLETALFQAKVETIPWEKRFEICLGVAQGLEFLHNHPGKIVHGNIKASNILLDGNYKPKLSDFGFASVYTEEDQFSVIRQEASRGYLAHEYCQGENPTLKTDIYSFGVLLIEIVAGKKNKVVVPQQETIYLVDEVHKHFNENRTNIKKLVDKKFSNDHYIDEQAEEILKLAMKCTSQPSLRPDISEVVRVLNDVKKKAEDEKSPVKVTTTTIDEGTGSSA